MYLRATQRRNQDGSVVRYLQLAHNRRVDGVTQAEVLVNLGREDRLDPGGLRRLVRSINRYLGEDDAGAAPAGEWAGDGLSVVESRPAGTAWLLDGLWRQLGVDGALRQVLSTLSVSEDHAVDAIAKLQADTKRLGREVQDLKVKAALGGRAHPFRPSSDAVERRLVALRDERFIVV